MDINLSRTQCECLSGNLLGDGGLSRPISKNANSYFYFSQAPKNIEYVEGLREIYNPFVKECFYTKNKLKDREFIQTRFETNCNKVFTAWRQRWYKEPYAKGSQKIVPNDLVLTWRMAGLWACDDGSNIYYRREFKLCTHCFAKPYIDYLLEHLLLDLGVKGKVYLERKKPVISLIGDQGEHFINGIKLHVPWRCMQYKLKWRDSRNPNTSGTVGVSKVGNLWQANIMKYGTRGIRYFPTKEEAIIQRKNWEKGVYN